MSQKQLAQEYPPAGEAETLLELTERFKEKVLHDNPVGLKRRSAHAKMHGVVKAEFIVEPDLPPELRIGVFREPKAFQAWVRYSNQDGVINPDKKGDIRGMAIKLMGVPGDKLLQQEMHEQTQDFILCSTPNFFTRDAQEFNDLMKGLTGGLFAKLLFFITHLRVLFITFKAMKKVANPLQIRYWSSVPYLLGSKAVKYSATPQGAATDTIPDNPADDFLRRAMRAQLDKAGANFDFAVQFQTNADKMPIEDSRVEWNEAVSPFRKVATVKIFPQQFDDGKQNEFGENLSYSPWHSLPEHRPLGGINRARKVVYENVSQFRHQLNQAPRREPASWEI